MADETVSGLTPTITLSGIQGSPSFSGGSQQPTASGMSGYGGAQPGIEGGLGLDMLSQLLQQTGAGDTGTGVGALTPFTSQSLGQQSGGLGAGAFGQQGGQGLVAGATGQGSGAQANTAAGSADPLAILQKLLGLGSKAAGAAGSLLGTASPTVGDTGGTSLSDQLRSSQAAQGGNAQLNGIIPTASPTLGTAVDVAAGGIPGTAGTAAGAAGDFAQQFAGSPLSLTNQVPGGPGGVPHGTPDQELIQTLLGAGLTPDQISSVFGAQGFGAGEIPTGGSIPSGVSGAPTASPLSSLSGGVSAAQGGAT